jgi:hypothetical protein
MESIHKFYHIFVLIATIITYIILKKSNKENSFKKNFLISLYTPIILYIAYYFMLYLQNNVSSDITDVYQSSISL